MSHNFVLNKGIKKMEAEEVEINEDSSEESEELEEIEDPYEEFEEIDDFTENDGWPVELELPAKNAKKEEKSFEILETTEAVLEDAYKKIIEVQQIICVSISSISLYSN